MIGKPHIVQNSRESGYWGLAGHPDRMSCEISSRATGFLINGLMLRCPPMTLKLGNSSRPWGPMLRAFLSYSFRMGQNFLTAHRRKSRRRLDCGHVRKRISTTWQSSVEGRQVSLLLSIARQKAYIL